LAENVGLPPREEHLPPPRTKPREYHRWIYVVYKVNGKARALAFDRGYFYCCGLNEEAFCWLLENREIAERDAGSAPMQLGTGTP
jgi:hypothetical protein